MKEKESRKWECEFCNKTNYINPKDKYTYKCKKCNRKNEIIFDIVWQQNNINEVEDAIKKDND